MPVLYYLAIPLLGINSIEIILFQEAFMKVLQAALCPLVTTRNPPKSMDSKWNE